MTKVVVTTGKDISLEQRRRSRLEDAVTLSKATASALPSLWFIGRDEELKLQYQAFCQADCNVPALFVIVMINVVFLVMRGSWWRMYEMNTVMHVAMALSLVNGCLGTLNFYIRASLWEPVASYQLPPDSLLYQARTYFQKLNDSSLLFVFLNDSLFMLFPVVLNLNVLGRTFMGPCVPGLNFWDTQYCNPDGPNRYRRIGRYAQLYLSHFLSAPLTPNPILYSHTQHPDRPLPFVDPHDNIEPSVRARRVADQVRFAPIYLTNQPLSRPYLASPTWCPQLIPPSNLLFRLQPSFIQPLSSPMSSPCLA